MNTQKQIIHYRCIVAHPPRFNVGDKWPNDVYEGAFGSDFILKDYPHLWEPVYKKEPLCHLPDEHGKMQAMYRLDEYWFCSFYEGEWLCNKLLIGYSHTPEEYGTYNFATKAAAEAKAAELNKVEHDNEKVYTRGEMEKARELLERARSCIDGRWNVSLDINDFLKQSIK